MPHRAFSACSAFVLDREVFGRNAVDHGQIQSLVTAMGIDLAAARALCLTASRALTLATPPPPAWSSWPSTWPARYLAMAPRAASRSLASPPSTGTPRSSASSRAPRSCSNACSPLRRWPCTTSTTATPPSSNWPGGQQATHAAGSPSR
ncbi:acyl-CoA dehydrogenase family protein [Streptomyces sp. NPDC054871]